MFSSLARSSTGNRRIIKKCIRFLVGLISLLMRTSTYHLWPFGQHLKGLLKCTAILQQIGWSHKIGFYDNVQPFYTPLRWPHKTGFVNKVKRVRTTTGLRQLMKRQKRLRSSMRAPRTAFFSVSSNRRYLSVTSCIALSSWFWMLHLPAKMEENGFVKQWPLIRICANISAHLHWASASLLRCRSDFIAQISY